MEAARLAGLPLLEQADYAMFILRLPINSKEADKLLDVRLQEKPPEFRILWNVKDPSPKDKTLEIQDWEFKKRRGKNFTIVLIDSEKEELKRRQTYYVLNGGVLGSQKEIPRETDTIIVDLNFVFEKSQFNQIKTQESFSKHIAFAEKVYGVIDIKFYSTWTAGTGDWEKRTITEGRKDGFVNVYLSVRKQKDGFAATDTVVDEKTGEITTKDIFLAKGQLEGGGITNYSLREEALAHELGHKFGIVAYYGKKIPFTDVDIGNIPTDIEINSAISTLARGAVRKNIDWNKLGRSKPVVVSNMREFWETVTTYDKIRLGARGLSKAQ